MVSVNTIASIALFLGLASAQQAVTISYNPVYDGNTPVANLACGGADGPNTFSTICANEGWLTLDRIPVGIVAAPVAADRSQCGSCWQLRVGANTINVLVADASAGDWVVGLNPEWTSLAQGSTAGQLAGTAVQVDQSHCVQ